jgi:hypothetical protein
MGWLSKTYRKAIGGAQDAAAAVVPVAYLANAPVVQGAQSRLAGGSVASGVTQSFNRYAKALGLNKGPTAPGSAPGLPDEASLQDPDAQGRAERRRRRLLAAQGRGSTLLTGAGGGGSLGLGSGNSLFGV